MSELPEYAMIERVANALYVDKYGSNEGLLTYPNRRLSKLKRRARAAIEAMREPTEAMSCTPLIAIRNNCVNGVLPTGEEAAGIWRDMIDEALK